MSLAIPRAEQAMTCTAWTTVPTLLKPGEFWLAHDSDKGAHRKTCWGLDLVIQYKPISVI